MNYKHVIKYNVTQRIKPGQFPLIAHLSRVYRVTLRGVANRTFVYSRSRSQNRKDKKSCQ